MRDTCLTNSILLCRVLRQSGIRARVNFGVMKDSSGSGGMNTAGHCWVTVAEEDISPPYPVIFTYP